MDIEPPIKPATDSDDNKSNDSTASQPQHLQEMAKSIVVSKESPSPIPPNENANVEILAPVSTASLHIQPESPQIPQSEVKPSEAPPLPEPIQPHGMHSAPPVASQIPPTASVPGPISHPQEAPIPPPNVTVSHHQGVGMPGHLPPPPHGYPHGYQQGPPRPFYGHMPPYQQGFQQYPPYMPPYQQNYHAPHGYPVGGENHNPYQQGPAMHAPVSHQPMTLPPTTVASPPAAQPEEAPEKNGS